MITVDVSCRCRRCRFTRAIPTTDETTVRDLRDAFAVWHARVECVADKSEWEAQILPHVIADLGADD